MASGGGGGGAGAGEWGRSELGCMYPISSLEELRDHDRLGVVCKAIRSMSLSDYQDQDAAYDAIMALQNRLYKAMRDALFRDLLRLFPDVDAGGRAAIGTMIASVYDKVDNDRELGRVFDVLKNAYAGVMYASAEDQRFGRTTQSRAHCAGKARDVFTEYAYAPIPEDAPRDFAGNPRGSCYDLGRDSKFIGLHIVIYMDEPVSISHVVDALTRKGFHVKVFVGDELPRRTTDLNMLLRGVSQMWIVSPRDGTICVSRDRAVAIRHSCDNGMGLFIFGQVFAPYRALLSTRRATRDEAGGDLYALGDGPRMLKHPVSTGLSGLYEGTDVSGFHPEDIKRGGFKELLRGSEGDLIAILGSPTDNRGPIVWLGKGTQTWLSSDWSAAGIARFVVNCACWLGASEDPGYNGLRVEDFFRDRSHRRLAHHWYHPAYHGGRHSRTEDCLVGGPRLVCNITGNLGVVSMIASSKVTFGGICFNSDPFEFGIKFRCTSVWDSVVSRPLAKRFAADGETPMGTAVLEELPVVDLDDTRRCDTFRGILRRIYDCGYYVDMLPLMIHLGVCDDKLLDIETEDTEVWRFQRDQILRHVEFDISKTFLRIGDNRHRPEMSLRDAIRTHLVARGNFDRLSGFLSFASACRLLRFVAEERLLPAMTLFQVARRFFVREIAYKCRDLARESLVYECFHGLPIQGTGRPTTFDDAMKLLDYDHDETRRQMGLLMGALRRICSAKLPTLVGGPELTLLMLRLSKRSEDDVHTAIEEHLLCDVESFSEGAALEALVTTVPPTAGHAERPPFATCLGPSMFRCVCGEAFGDPTKPVTPESVEEMEKRRAAHFTKVGVGGSRFVCLHRPVQKVMTMPHFVGIAERTEDVEIEVARRLKAANSGILFSPDIAADIRSTIDSYLACRARGDPEPYLRRAVLDKDGVPRRTAHVDNMSKAIEEQRILYPPDAP